ncbi:hypothetical protein IX317_000354 [Fusobacterium sp. DD29]|uniref:hypothetical protein n=1 Tax=unclassified Fusobacterium TaxID=2648384 RepID=UPI001B8C8F1F|nr:MULTISPECIES: hypothetical protein [unclassified Fusobacterium]MBR8748695.1 hypothetical protein [Fusobacterium sp. DD29]MBR8760953.1 hypothetical protein [Fusobacterium sp. DD25]MBR8766974.1 hypothetical protein [Fusobacterium sp. DD43]MBR8770975.1 hypothetical protein [Fusobacterium sp. DD40]MBR8775250.1 hypothetical protein [Fusobacterium sp. DD17]
MDYKELKDRLVYPILLSAILGGYAAWQANDKQTTKNTNDIKYINKQVDEISGKCNGTEYELNNLKIQLPDSYITRREFNKIMELQTEKMNEINRNIEKLLDLQLKKRG